ncbi:MAG: MATE family efflux transporter [Nocardioides sp.]
MRRDRLPSPPERPDRATDRAHDREILRLAWPAFLALVAEPLFLLADAAIVGHLGTGQLAGLGVAAAVLQTLVGLCIFLAYGTTASVARHLGAGDGRRPSPRAWTGCGWPR